MRTTNLKITAIVFCWTVGLGSAFAAVGSGDSDWFTIDNRPSAADCSTCAGDLDGDNWIMFNDLLEMIAMLSQAGSPYRISEGDALWQACADLNGDNWIMFNDLLEVIALLSQAGSPYRIPCP